MVGFSQVHWQLRQTIVRETVARVWVRSRGEPQHRSRREAPATSTRESSTQCPPSIAPTTTKAMLISFFQIDQCMFAVTGHGCLFILFRGNTQRGSQLTHIFTVV
jgi:hypothetical protein